MRICHVTSAHPANDPRIAHKQAASASCAGHEITLVAPDLQVTPPASVHYHPIRRASGRFDRVFRVAPQALLAAARTSPDVYHLHDPELLLWVPLLRIFTRGQFVFDAHESLPDQIMSKHWIPSPARRPLSGLTATALRLLTWFCSGLVHAVPHTVGTFAARPEIVVRNFPIVRRPNDAAPVRREPGITRLIYVGVISPIRGSIEMVEACAKASETSATRLQLVGRLEPPTHLSELESLSGWPCAEYEGVIDHQAVSALLAQADIGLALLHPVPNYLISYPTKVFEYVAAGLSVVVSDFPLWRELFGALESVRFVDPMNADQIAETIVSLASDPQRESAAKRAAQRVLDEMNWDTEFARLNDFYARLTAGQHAGS